MLSIELIIVILDRGVHEIRRRAGRLLSFEAVSHDGGEVQVNSHSELMSQIKFHDNLSA